MREDLFDSLVSGAELSSHEAFALKARAGLIDGEPQSVTKIGEGLKSLIGRETTRQYAHILLKKAALKVGEAGTLVQLLQEFPALEVSRVADLKPPSNRTIGSRVRYRISRLSAHTEVQYGRIMQEAEVPIPEHRARMASILSEEDSMRAFNEDFGIRRFGNRAKFCRKCGNPRLLTHFYKFQGGTRVQPYCKSCNTDLCRERYRTRNGTSGRPSYNASRQDSSSSSRSKNT